MTNTNILNTQSNTLNNAKRAFKSLVIAFVACLTLYMVATPLTAKAFDMNELTTLVSELTSQADEALATEVNVDPESDNFVEDTEEYGKSILEIAEAINAKQPEIEGLAQEITGEGQQYADNALSEDSLTTQFLGLFEGMSLETFVNAIESVKNGEELQADSDLGNQLLQVAGLQSPKNPIMEAVIYTVRSILGLMLVSTLFWLAKRQINKQMYDY